MVAVLRSSVDAREWSILLLLLLLSRPVCCCCCEELRFCVCDEEESLQL